MRITYLFLFKIILLEIIFELFKTQFFVFNTVGKSDFILLD